MNFSAVMPRPTISINKPIKVSPRGNMYKIPIVHHDAEGNHVGNYEVWATREAVQKHFEGTTEMPRDYQLKRFARQMYEKQIRSHGGRLPQAGMLATTEGVTHGNPKLWPHTLVHPEVKI